MKQKQISILILSTMIGIAVIAINYVWAITPIQLQEYPIINHKEMTIEQKICNSSQGEYCELLIKLAKCESSLNPDAIHVNKNGSADLGIMQINTIHKDISNSDKFNVEKAVKWTLEKIKKGDGNIWVCWNKI